MISKLRLKKPGMISKNENEKGVVIIAVIGLIALLVLFGTMGVVTTSTEIIISKNHKTSVQARYTAEAGIHRSIGMLNSTPGWIGSPANPNPTVDAFPGDNSFGNGTYVVKVYENDPVQGSIRINSTGNSDTSSSIVEVILIPQYYGILDYATFNCGNLTLKDGEANVISGGDVFVSGNLNLVATGIHQIQDGNVYAMGDIKIEGSSSITGGNAFANGNIDVLSSASPNIDGNATAGGGVSDWDKVSGTITEDVSPDPVAGQCGGTDLADITVTSEDIQYFRDNATTTINDNYTFNSGHNYTGIVHITGNFYLTGNETFSGDVIFIVDGNAEISGSLTSTNGSNVTFLVPTNNFIVKSGGNFTIDGTVIVGTVDSDGSNKSGGNINVNDGSDLTVNGNLIAINGNIDAGSGGALTVTYQAPSDSNLIAPNSYTMTQWREVR